MSHSRNTKPRQRNTSWESSQKWYQKTVAKDGHYYHQHIILPSLLSLMNLQPQDALLDLGCGQGILERKIPKSIEYLGIDLSPSLVREAKQQTKQENHRFIIADVTLPLKGVEQQFSHAAVVLALQNMRDPHQVVRNAASLLKPHGKLFLVLNHPCFRVPRQSSWGVDESKKLQYRRVDRYRSPMEVPITMHPGKGNQSAETISFHWSLQDISSTLSQSGFCIKEIHEWYSDKESDGGNAKMENKAREEIPLFMCIVGETCLY